MDLYATLGLRRGANLTDIRRAYRKLARLLHPSINPGDPVAAERFRIVAHAFEVLSDSQRRGAYDRGEPEPTPVAAVPDVGFEGFDFTAEMRPGGVGFGDIFGTLTQPPPAPTRGEDLEQATRISFEESMTGVRRRVQLVRQEACPACGGSGELAREPVACPRCAGSGRLRASRGRLRFWRRCPDCDATGQLRRRTCARCEGGGRVMQAEWLEVQIPPGAGDGSRVRVPGCGNVGLRGGPAGDFVLIVEVEPHPLFRRHGDDLYCELPVSVTEAALGAHIAVRTPDGSVTIEIPAGTQSGQRFRLRKRGVPQPSAGTRGDLYVEAVLVVPAVTDDRGRALLAELAQLYPEDPRRANPRAAGAKERS